MADKQPRPDWDRVVIDARDCRCPAPNDWGYGVCTCGGVIPGQDVRRYQLGDFVPWLGLAGAALALGAALWWLTAPDAEAVSRAISDMTGGGVK